MVSRLHKSVLSTFYSMNTVRLSGEIYAGIWMIFDAIILFDWQIAFRKQTFRYVSSIYAQVQMRIAILNVCL